ncbi:MAG: class C sortase [Clostridiales Family XIII bacterium]|jgi:sortase A|nr:class C sortase [Clostridiales Family XIII bacterium]
MNRKLFVVLALALIVGGAAVFAYPWVGAWWNARQSQALVDAYEAAAAAGLSPTQVDEQFARARAYNERVSALAPYDPFTQAEPVPFPEYGTILVADDSGMMASLEIPSIGLTVPVYHGVADAALSRGIGHMPTTALPVGGEGTHCVLVGHNGLASRVLFTHLDKVAVGDGFILRVLGRPLGYRVDQILVTEPEDTAALLPAPGREYVSLVTCTPYGVNSHRLLVRGVRDDSVLEEGGTGRAGLPLVAGALRRMLLIMALAIAGALAAVYCLPGRRGRRRET